MADPPLGGRLAGRPERLRQMSFSSVVNRSADAELRALLMRIADGDRTAVAALYDRTVMQVFRTLRTTMGCSSLAETATLEVYRELWSRGRSYDPDHDVPRRWLYAAVRRQVGDSLRSHQVRRSGDGNG